MSTVPGTGSPAAAGPAVPATVPERSAPATVPAPTVAITGASGYLGGVVRARLSDDGWRTVGLVRTPGGGDRRYVLEEAPPEALLDGVDVLVHCAWDLSLVGRSAVWTVNVAGTRALLDLAVRSGVRRVVVLSSMSAYDGTDQDYGRAKLEVERHARGVGALSVRPGLVYGPGGGGMAGALTRLTRLPVVPVVAPRSHQFTVHEDDFADAMAALVAGGVAGGDPIGIANPVPVPFRRLVEGLARRQGRACRTLTVDGHVVLAGLRLAEALGIRLPFRSDLLLGLMRPAPSVPNLDVLEGLGVTLRRFEEPWSPRAGAVRPDRGPLAPPA